VKKNPTYSFPAKTAVFLLLIVMACVTAAGAVGAFYLLRYDFYAQSRTEIKQETFDSMASDDSWVLLTAYLSGGADSAAEFCEGTNLLPTITDGAGTVLWSNAGASSSRWQTVNEYRAQDCGADDSALLQGQSYTVRFLIRDSFPQQDAYALANRIINFGYALRYWIYAIGIGALIAGICCFLYLLCAAGRRPGCDGVASSSLTRMPLDLLAALIALAAGGVLSFFLNDILQTAGTLETALWLAGLYVAAVAAGTGFCMNLAVRSKLGGFWKNTILCRAGTFCGRGIRAVARNLPLLWKCAVLLAVLTLTEFFFLSSVEWAMSLFPLWLLEKLILIPLVLWLALVMSRLQRGGEALAAGNLTYQIRTARMPGDFRKHGENLNSIAAGMNAAVEERLRSERLKTELITNVSHDIKTPLTSIINYADLISREPTDNEKIGEYAQVLYRQSERLKKLIEDLVEASKASTGNVEVHLAPCEINVLLAQTAGEYTQRLKERGLELITRQPDAPVRIAADGRHLWRVFDNLMSNICKYAQEGTRVYLSVEAQDGDAVIVFKNISKYPLETSPEELKERFVRGDPSRKTEGSGLGLSIAQSLTELQGGRLELAVDGDLFKAILRFPLLKGEDGQPAGPLAASVSPPAGASPETVSGPAPRKPLGAAAPFQKFRFRIRLEKIPGRGPES